MGRGFDLCGAELSFILFDSILKVYIICIAKAETFANYKLKIKVQSSAFYNVLSERFFSFTLFLVAG